IRPPHAFEPGCPSVSLRVRDKRMDQDLDMYQDWSSIPPRLRSGLASSEDERMDQDLFRWSSGISASLGARIQRELEDGPRSIYSDGRAESRPGTGLLDRDLVAEVW